MQDASPMGDIANAQRQQITAPKLAVDGEIKKREIPYPFCQLQADANGPDLLQLQGPFLTDDSSLVPRGVGLAS